MKTIAIFGGSGGVASHLTPFLEKSIMFCLSHLETLMLRTLQLLRGSFQKMTLTSY